MGTTGAYPILEEADRGRTQDGTLVLIKDEDATFSSYSKRLVAE